MSTLKPKKRAAKESLSVQVETLLMDEVRKLAAQERISLRSIVEYGLKRYIEDSIQLPLFKKD